MASLAEILGFASSMGNATPIPSSSMIPNEQGMYTQPGEVEDVKPLAPEGYQRPKGLRNTIGSIADILSVLGGQPANYRASLDQAESKYKDESKQRAFSQFLTNPDDPAAKQAYIQADPSGYLGYMKQMAPKPQSEGSLPREVVIARMLDDPNVPDSMKQRLVSLIEKPVATPRPVATADGYLLPQDAIGRMPYRAPPAASGNSGPSGSDFQIIQTPEGYARVDKISGEVLPLNANVMPRGAGGGAAGKPARGAQTPQETLALIDTADKLLNKASSGGLSGLATGGLEFLGVNTGRGEADASLNVVGARLAATVPRFEGPQSDKDTAAYKAAAADVANRNLSTDTRRAALRIVKEITQRQAKAQARAPAPATRAAPPVQGNRPPLSSFMSN